MNRMNLNDHLNQFYLKYNIPANGGVNDKTFEVPLPYFNLILPNYSWRKKMLHIHDLEHILNDQDTTWNGEMFIASWEISTGFWKNFPVCIFPLWTMGWGLWKHPSTVLKGFRRGQSDQGIAGLNFSQQSLLAMNLPKLQSLTQNQHLHHSGLFSNFKLVCWSLISQIVFLSPLLTLGLALAFIFY